MRNVCNCVLTIAESDAVPARIDSKREWETESKQRHLNYERKKKKSHTHKWSIQFSCVRMSQTVHDHIRTITHAIVQPLGCISFWLSPLRTALVFVREKKFVIVQDYIKSETPTLPLGCCCCCYCYYLPLYRTRYSEVNECAHHSRRVCITRNWNKN